MRSVNFRDDVLWAIAEKDGLDPTVDLLNDLAREYVSSINAWLRRLYDVADWPEWAEIQPFIPNPSTHVISWDASPFGSTDTSDLVKIGKVFKVYLCDPRITPGNAMDAPFRLTSAGIHVGFDHGATVWLKFIPRTPVFTSEVWNSARSYQKDEITYSTTLGECCNSKVNNNKGHDPAGETATQAIQSEIVQQRAPLNVGLSVVKKKVRVYIDVFPPSLTSPPDPPPNNSTYYIPVTDSTGLVGSALVNPNGVQSKVTVLGLLAAALTAALPGSFIVTTDTGNLTIDIENGSDFFVNSAINAAIYAPPPPGTPIQVMQVTQLQAYIPAVTAGTGDTRQIVALTLPASQAKPGATYDINILDETGQLHTASYVALSTDGALQILSGVIAAIQTASLTDTFLTDVWLSIEPTMPLLTLNMGNAGSVELLMTPPNSAYWSLVPFPFALADQVVRGVYADSLKTGGQSDKGNAEEQAVPTETQLRMSAALASGSDTLTDQQTSRGRYAR